MALTQEKTAKQIPIYDEVGDTLASTSEKATTSGTLGPSKKNKRERILK